jgi:hypothetical protein
MWNSHSVLIKHFVQIIEQYYKDGVTLHVTIWCLWLYNMLYTYKMHNSLPDPNLLQHQDTIPHDVNLSLTLLNMGKNLPETCWAELGDQSIVILASSWTFCFIYLHWWCTVKHKSNIERLQIRIFSTDSPWSTSLSTPSSLFSKYPTIHSFRLNIHKLRSFKL